MMRAIIAFLFHLLIIPRCPYGEEVKDIHLMGLVPNEGPFPVWETAMVSVGLALDHIHNRSDLLAGYRLVLHVNDTGVSIDI